MHKKKGKIYATLTEVKNQIGDVFAAVDEHGAVTITSYNKEKYIISKVQPPQMPEIIEDIAESKSTVSKQKPLRAEPPAIEETIVPELYESPAPEMPTIYASERTETAPMVLETEPLPAVDVFEIFRGIGNDELFIRNSDRELNWTTKARANL